MKARSAFCLITLIVCAVILVPGCRKKTAPTEAPAAPGAVKPPGVETLPVDKAYQSGTVKAVTIEMQTKVDVPGLIPSGALSEELKKAIEKSTTKQLLAVSDDRGKITFATEDFLVPKDSELRYQPGHKKYVLTDPQKKSFWVMSGAEIGNLLEGGPQLKRNKYSLQIVDTDEKKKIAGYDAVRTNAEIGFDWTAKSKGGQRSGKVKVLLSIWHSANSQLKPAWGQMVVDLLSVPFQDEEGIKIVEQLKGRVKFPLEWSMEMKEIGEGATRADLPPRLITTAQKVQIGDIERASLASPPNGAVVAAAPYEFGQDGQTVAPEVLGQIPAELGQPPK